ncbi:NADP-dependent oxidoreductase [Cohnella nanjingensis]|uniref:NADP-dependent oxidoreductase n=1 Tax=Cohnella nanjingensis TaxID=1387779 RepID=A0A7X0RWT2_9BACL|nr:NADP-dependent oxidoreductase [Cohnella nanjingensis]MBB6675122.1 NADP-dependent oxidoreductase [Cohnella nanjingensis]
MRAAGFDRYGPPDVLELMEVKTPQAGAGEVRVRVKTAGVQPADCSVRKGWMPPGATVTLPHVPGNEFAGVIDQVGPDVAAWKVGAEVLGYRMQYAYAEYVVAPADQIVAKPPGMPWEVAGSLSASGQTAHTAMDELRIGPGDTVLINGAAGGVGTVAVQLAKRLGATVIGTASAANQDYLRSLGAIPVVYGDGLEARVRALAPNGIDSAFDTAGGEGLRAAAAMVRDPNRVGTIAGFDLTEELGIRAIRSQRSGKRLAALADLYERGALRIHVRSIYPLDRAAEAHREVEVGHGQGKVVLRVDDRKD